ncbi:MAG TPA: YetF domain-containing protein [Anaerolineae bacterium]|nr:YetF domain-containing protein [Anaerolineae bacterium]
MDFTELLLTAARTTAVYFFMLAVVRLLGKREIGALGAFDLIVAFMLGEVVDEMVYGDVTLVQGFLVITVVAGGHFLNAWASYKNKHIQKFTEAAPRVLIENGQILREALAKERMSEDELYSQLRLQSIDDIQEVKCARLEPNGQVSILEQEWAKPLQKRDLTQLQQKRSQGNGRCIRPA